MKVWLRNPKTGALKHVPASRHAHYRILALWFAAGLGVLVLILVAHQSVPSIPIGAIIAGLVCGLVGRSVTTLRDRGSALTARGWQFAEPDSAAARMAAAEWRSPPLPASAASPKAPAPFALDEDAFLASTAGISTAPSQSAPSTPRMPFQTPTGGSIFMRILMYVVAALAFLIGILCAAATRSDIQLGMSLTAFIGSFILLGLGHIMGRLAR